MINIAPPIDNAGVILGGSGRGCAVFAIVAVALFDVLLTGLLEDKEVDATASENVEEAVFEMVVGAEDMVLLLLLPLLSTGVDELVTEGLALVEELWDEELVRLVADADCAPDVKTGNAEPLLSCRMPRSRPLASLLVASKPGVAPKHRSR